MKRLLGASFKGRHSTLMFTTGGSLNMKITRGICLHLLIALWLVLPAWATSAYALVLPDGDVTFTNLVIESVQDGPIVVDKQRRLRVLGVTAEGFRFPYDGRVKWLPSNDVVAISDSGYITGLKEGSSVVRVDSIDEPRLNGTSEVTVIKEPVLIYFQAPKNWNKANVWYWYLDGDADASGLDKNGQALNAITAINQGAFPGPLMKPVAGWPGWFSIALPRFDDQSQYPGRSLVRQPIRLVFSNPDNGEKTRDFQHYDGCFYSYNRYLRPGLIDGRWDSPNNCPVFPKKLRPIAEPMGGPVWSDKSFVNALVQGQTAANALARYTLDRTLPSATNGKPFTNGQTLNIDQEIAINGKSTVCLWAAQNEQQNSECFQFYKADPEALRDYRNLGATYSEQSTTFAIWSPDRNSVELWLDGQTIPMGYIGDAIKQPGVWAVTVPGNYYLKRYQFILDDVPVRDPYAVMVEPGTDFCIVMDPLRIQPEGGWAQTPPLVNREDAVIYEMSVRDFTFSPTSGVTPELRGKFLGLVEPNTYLYKGQEGADAAIKTGIDHLKELGVTHVQLMPVFDYATCSLKDRKNGPNCYNWGYDPENFNVVEERYSTRPNDYEHRVREFKTMVNELHKAGIRVIMDVVYNHTWVRPWREADEGEKYFGDITGKYFLFDADGIGYQLTGTGNTIDPKEPMVNKYIKDSLEYWVNTYNIDGFRFDVAGVFDYDEITGWMTHLYDRFPDKQLLNYGEPYTALTDTDPHHFRLNGISRMTRADGKAADFGGFNFSYREAIKGNNDSGFGGGYAFNDTYKPQTIINGLRGSLGAGDIDTSAFTGDPVQTINYVTSHDNLNLFDKINAWSSLQTYNVDLAYKKRIQVFANAIVLMSQGVPLLHSGEEIMRTKSGIPDSYQAADPVNKLDWTRKKAYKDVSDAYSQLIQARRRFAGLRLPSREEIERSLSVQQLSPGLFEIRIAPNGKQRNELVVLLNSGGDRDYSLPSGEWNLVLEQGRVTTERKVSGRIKASGTAATLFYR